MNQKRIDTRSGYTTGTYAVGAVKAALFFLLNKKAVDSIKVALPINKYADILVKSVSKVNNSAHSVVIKKSVEEADVTHNMEIHAVVSFRKDKNIVIDGGVGVGRASKPGLPIPIGKAAINPVPEKMVRSAVMDLTSKGVNVLIFVPEGKSIAAKTTNSKLGIIGGVSIIGTTGIMKPKSLESFKVAITQRLNFFYKNSIKNIFIVPGNISEKAVLTLFGDRVSDKIILQSGDYLGYTLKESHKKDIKFILAGHPGKLAKVLSGHFQTHYTKSPQANGHVINLLKNSLDDNVVKEMEESATVEGIINILYKYNKENLLNFLAETIENKVKLYLGMEPVKDSIQVLLFSMKGKLIGTSKSITTHTI